MSSETTDTQRQISHAVDNIVEPGHTVDEPATGDHKHGLTDMGYVKVALVLAFMTALLGLMVLKFWTVVSYFMHLKFDNPIFTKLFYSGLILAVLVYCAALLTFQFFDPS